MGNNASTHHLQHGGISDLNSYHRSTSRGRGQMRRQPPENASPTFRRQFHEAPSGWAKSFPRPKTHSMGYGNDSPPPPQFKVLPHLNESRKLRTTTNGAILHSGGTISGRREQQQLPTTVDILPRTQSQQPPPMQMQRSRTLIDMSYERREQERNVMRASADSQMIAAAAPQFRRAQTQFQMEYRGGSRQQTDDMSGSTLSTSDRAAGGALRAAVANARSEPDLRLSPTHMAKSNTETFESQQNAARAGKTNKYNKKRKAPAAPAPLMAEHTARSPLRKSSADVDGNNNNKNNISSGKSQTLLAAPASMAYASKETLAKARLFRTKAETNASSVVQRRPAPTIVQQKSAPVLPMPPPAAKQPQQQKKLQRSSFDDAAPPAVSQVQRHNFVRSSMNITSVASPAKSAQQRQQLPNVVGAPPLPYRREKSFDATLLRARDTPELPLVNTPLHAATLQRSTAQKERQQKELPITKIPQLKRTFYFGMDNKQKAAEVVKRPEMNVANSQSIKVAATAAKKPAATLLLAEAAKEATAIVDDTSACSSLSFVPVYDIGMPSKEYEDDANNSSGLQVLLRPMLPRRQLEIPRFSPAAAWRMLTEEQKNLQMQRQPIRLVTTKKSSKQPTMLSEYTAVPVTATTPSSSRREQKENDNNSDELGEPVTLTATFINHQEAPIQPIRKAPPKLMPEPSPLQLHKSANAQLPPWTPQQDLEEDDDDDDSSADEYRMQSNGGAGDDSLYLLGAKGAAAAAKSRNAKPVHVFSLSLPRESGEVKGAAGRDEKIQKSGFSSLQKLKRTVSGGNCGCIQTKYGDHHIMDHILGSVTAAHADATDAAAETPDTATHEAGSCLSNYRSDNWVLGKTTLGLTGKQTVFGAVNTTAGNVDLQHATADKTRWDSLASMEPISLSYLTAGKHVMYLPGAEGNEVGAATKVDPKSASPEVTQKERRTRHKRESLQDVPVATVERRYRDHPADALLEKSQRFSFQSTVRLLEKRRLADKLSKDAELKEAQRRSELEAMKRVEEDFQRKRAFEKASIRQQLRLVSNMEQFQSLPTLTGATTSKEDHKFDRPKHQHEDANNNTYYRADPDGAVSSPSCSPTHNVMDTEHAEGFRTKTNVDYEKTRSSGHFDFRDDRDSDIEADLIEFQRTASLLEPYLQSIVK